MVKKEVPLKLATRLINHGPLVIVGSKYEGKESLMTVAWIMPLSKQPPLAGFMITKKRFSYGLIHGSQEFSINIPDIALLNAAIKVGTVSGRDVKDKFKEAAITREDAKFIGAPLIKECLAQIECKLIREEELGDHILMVGEILRACVEENVFTDHWLLENHNTIAHFGGEWFGKTTNL